MGRGMEKKGSGWGRVEHRHLTTNALDTESLLSFSTSCLGEEICQDQRSLLKKGKRLKH